MALLNNKSYIVPSVLIDLTFEDNIKKIYEVHTGDIVHVVFNKDGIATAIDGKVTAIGTGNANKNITTIPRFHTGVYHADGIATCDTVYGTNIASGEYMVIDCSGAMAGNVVTVFLSTILDFGMVMKFDQNAIVQSDGSCGCKGISQIHKIRVKDGVFQYSCDYGATWKSLLSDSLDLDSDNVKGVLPVSKGGTGVSTREDVISKFVNIESDSDTNS